VKSVRRVKPGADTERVSHAVINVEETIGKEVGQRTPPSDPLEAGTEWQSLVVEMHPKLKQRGCRRRFETVTGATKLGTLAWCKRSPLRTELSDKDRFRLAWQCFSGP